MPSIARAQPSPAALPQLQHLHCGPFSVAIAPHVGGSLASFCSALPDGSTRHWLRPATQEALDDCDPLRMASFPLVPWANRLRDGRFVLDDTQVTLSPNMEGDPHTIHGLGWQLPWQVCARSGQHIELQLHFPGSAEWPYAFQAAQTYTLDASGLHIAMTLRNTGVRRMPGDLGHHPYFPHQREGTGTRLTARVEAMWESDDALLPLQRSATHPAVGALHHGMALHEHVLDNNFSGFGGRALVEWPNGDTLQLKTQTPLDYFVVYSPADANVFCMEPVSNCTDWLNLRSSPADNQAPGAGGHVLKPGAALHAEFHLLPQASPT